MQQDSIDVDEKDIFNNITYPNTIWDKKEGWEVGVKLAVLVPIVTIGSMANAIILRAIFIPRNLKIPINYLFASMALADIATLLISPWMFFYRDTYQNYMLGRIGCKVEGYFEFSFFIVDVLNLVGITGIRLMAIAKPHKRISIQCAFIIIGGAWIVGFAAALPLIIFRTYKVGGILNKERQWSNFLEKYCSEDNTVLPIYWNVIVASMVWVPLAILLLSYSYIFYNLEKLTKNAVVKEHQGYVKFKKRAAKIIFIIVIVFIICRVPFTAVIFWRSILLLDPTPHTFGDEFEILWFIANTLIFLNAAINPIMYGLTSRCFRKPMESWKIIGWFIPKDPKRSNQESVLKVWTLPKLEPRRVSAGEIQKYTRKPRSSLG